MENSGFDRVAVQLPLYRDKLLELPALIKEQICDIRLKIGQPVTLFGREGPMFLRDSGSIARSLGPGLVIVNQSALQEVFLHICGHSVFSHENEIRQGYVQMPGGVRAGLVLLVLFITKGYIQFCLRKFLKDILEAVLQQAVNISHVV